MYAILLDPSNKPYLMSDIGQVAKFENEEIAKSEAKKYVSKYGTSKDFVVINLDTTNDNNINEVRKEIASLTIDLLSKGFRSTFFICDMFDQGVVTDKNNFKCTLALLENTKCDIGDLISYRDQLKNIINQADKK